MWWAIIALLCAQVVHASLLFGFLSRDGAILSASSKFAPNGVSLRNNFRWLRPVDQHTVIGLYGDNSDCEHVMAEVNTQCRLHELSFPKLSTTAIAGFCRHLIRKNLRAGQLKVNLIVAGYCTQHKACMMYWLDEIGSLKEVEYCAHGAELPFLLALLDRQQHLVGSLKSISSEQAKAVLKVCWESIRQRSAADYQDIQTVLIGPDGYSFQVCCCPLPPLYLVVVL